MKRGTSLFVATLAALATTLVLAGASWATVLYSDNFAYAPGPLLGQGGWTVTGTPTTPQQMVVGGSLSYSCYQNSGIANQVSLGPTGEDLNHSFANQTTGAVYAGLLVNVSVAQTAGDYFFHLNNLPTGTVNAGRVFVQKDPAGPNYAFGIRYAAAGTVAYTPFAYAPGSVHLLVLKYTFNPGANDDQVSLFIDPALGGAEPAPNVSFIDTGTDATQISAVNFRQGTAANAPTETVDGLLVGTTWADVTTPTSFSITATNGAGGTVSPPGITPVSCGGSQAYSITASGGYTIADVKVDGVSQGAIASYTFNNVQTNHTIDAQFAPVVSNYTITSSAGTGGSINPNGRTSVPAGGDQAYSIAADNCYTIADVTVDGVSQGPVSSYTFTNVQADHTINASFAPAGPYTISASSGPGGSIAPDGPSSVPCGGDQAYTITADDCNMIADVLVDGNSVVAVSSYTFMNVQSNHDIKATFTPSAPYTINSSAGPGGSIAPDGSTTVPCGGSQDYSITADACHTIADVVVDGVSQGPLANYAFTNVHSDHTITASFSTIQYTVNVTANGNGTVTKNPDQATYDCGSKVTLSAQADAGWQFDGWSGDASGNANPLSVIVDGNKNIVANFSPIQRTLTINVVGNGTVTKNPDQPTYNDGQVVQLTATPGPGWVFVNWSGDAGGNANPLNVTMDRDRTITATFADVTSPTVQVIFPNGGENILVGGDVKIVYQANDNDTVSRIDLYVTRDNGGSYTPIAFNQPNTGSYVWHVDPPGTNTGITPVYSAKILILAYDPSFNQGSDESDNPFSIYDGTVAAIVTKLESYPIDGGVQLKWALGVRGVFQSISLERADNETGPWVAVNAQISTDGDQTVAVDNTAAAAHSYWYRLVGTTAQGQQASLGTVQGTAGAPHEFALRSAWPNPMHGVTGMTTEFSIARAANITLAVHDLQGRVVTTLAKGMYQAGRYQVKWDGRTDQGRVAAGVYFLRLTTPEKAFTTRLVVAE